MKNIKSIIFDLGVVLLNIDYQKTINEFHKLGISKASEFYSKKKQTNIFNLLECGKINDENFVKKIQLSCKNASKKQILFAWNALLQDLPQERIELLKNLKRKYPIYLLSNTNSIHISEFRRQIGDELYIEFYNIFNKVYYSYEIGYRKPNSQAFKIVIEENNLNPNEVLFIDDSPQHIEGAKRLGIQSHHLLDNEEITTLFPDIIL